jgi:hypothetical protein
MELELVRIVSFTIRPFHLWKNYPSFALWALGGKLVNKAEERGTLDLHEIAVPLFIT